MGYNSLFRSPKEEEQQVPDSIDTQFVEIKGKPYADKDGYIDIMDELEGIWGVSNEDEEQMEWEGFANGEDREDEREQLQNEFTRNFPADQESHVYEKKIHVKKENLGFWDEDENRVSLNLNLNYQEVLDAWSNRGPLSADDFSLSMASHGYYMGEVPVMEEDRTRREASVLRYKEKRQSRLFSKKIRYQVRKLNADKRARLKGRFVKRV